LRLYNVNRYRRDNDGVSVDNVIVLRKKYDHTMHQLGKIGLSFKYAREIANDTSVVLFTTIAISLWRR
jgi:hypothetical protein